MTRMLRRMTSSTKGFKPVTDIFMNGHKGNERTIMSHSVRQKLIKTKRFDVAKCAGQISNLVSENLFKACKSLSLDEIIYSYDGDCIEMLRGKKSYELGERLSGDFFDEFPGIEIEVRIVKDNLIDIDGYYYHTLDSTEEDGLIEVVVSISKDFKHKIKKEHLSVSIQSVLAHEMQHVVQRCYAGIDMAQIHDGPMSHLLDVREIDARVEEVLTGMEDILDYELFKSRMAVYMMRYFKRNKMPQEELEKSVLIHVEFHKEKMLEHFHNCTNVQNKPAGCTQVPNSVKVSSIVI